VPQFKGTFVLQFWSELARVAITLVKCLLRW